MAAHAQVEGPQLVARQGVGPCNKRGGTGECRIEAWVKGPSISATRTLMRLQAGLGLSFLSPTAEGAAWLTPLACAIILAQLQGVGNAVPGTEHPSCVRRYTP